MRRPTIIPNTLSINFGEKPPLNTKIYGETDHLFDFNIGFLQDEKGLSIFLR
ncbi:MAG: hypothetical protein QXI39_00085 [Candidatus Bathyarchaeia archaeon]